MSPRLNVIVVAHHSDRWLQPCIASLAQGTAIAWELLLVDNGGNTRLLAAVAAAPRASVLVAPRRMGFAEANNFALCQGGLNSKYVCFLNQDTVTRDGWLDACAACLEGDSTIGAVMPLITNYEGTAWDEAFLACAKAAPELAMRLRGGLGADLSDLPEFVAVPEITAAAMLVRTEALIQAGPFDPIYGSYYEDYDLCRRIAAAGYRVGICVRGRVGHYGGSVTTDRAAYCRRARWIARNRVIYAARWQWPSRPLGWMRHLVWQMPRDLVRAILGRSNIPPRSFVLAQMDLARILPRLVSSRVDQACWRKYLAAIAWENGPRVLQPARTAKSPAGI